MRSGLVWAVFVSVPHHGWSRRDEEVAAEEPVRGARGRSNMKLLWCAAHLMRSLAPSWPWRSTLAFLQHLASGVNCAPSVCSAHILSLLNLGRRSRLLTTALASMLASSPPLCGFSIRRAPDRNGRTSGRRVVTPTLHVHVYPRSFRNAVSIYSLDGPARNTCPPDPCESRGSLLGLLEG